MTENSSERTLLYILIGAGLFALAYLFFKDQFKGQNVQQMNLSDNSKSSKTEKQMNEIKGQVGRLEEQMGTITYQLGSLLAKKIDTQKAIDISSLEIPKKNEIKAGHVSNQKPNEHDIIRKLKFNMQ